MVVYVAVQCYIFVLFNNCFFVVVYCCFTLCFMCGCEWNKFFLCIFDVYCDGVVVADEGC